MPSARRSGVAAALPGGGGRVYVIGGNDGGTTASVDVLNVTSGSWAAGPSLANGRVDMAAGERHLGGDVSLSRGGSALGDEAQALFSGGCSPPPRKA